jgi:hypothetical protein
LITLPSTSVAAAEVRIDELAERRVFLDEAVGVSELPAARIAGLAS